MSAAGAAAALLLQLWIAWGLGRGLLHLLRSDRASRGAIGGTLGAIWLGFCIAGVLFDLVLWSAPSRWALAATALHVLGGSAALGCAYAGVSRWHAERRAKGPSRYDARASLHDVVWLLALAGAAVLVLSLGGAQLAAVDALEVYQLKARALHAGDLEELAPRTLGTSHPLLVSHAVAWHAQLRGGVSESAQIGFSLLAWLTAAVVFRRALLRVLPPAGALLASAAFALAPPLLALVPRGEADLALLASVLAAASAWSVGSLPARAAAIFFAAGAAAAKNEGMAWLAIGACAYLLGLAGGERASFSRRCGAALAAAAAVIALRLPALFCRARWGAFVEHLDGAALESLGDPLYLVVRGASAIDALGRAGCSAESGFAAPLWVAALALGLAGGASRARAALFLGCAWFACVLGGMLIGSYDVAWQAHVAGARVWIQASPWLVAALATAVAPDGARGELRSTGEKNEEESPRP